MLTVILVVLAACHRHPPDPLPLWSAGPGEDAGGGVVIEAVRMDETKDGVEIAFTYAPGRLPPGEAMSFHNTVLDRAFPLEEHRVHSRVAIALPGAWGFDPRQHCGEGLNHDLVDRVAAEDGPVTGSIVLVLYLHHPVAISFAVLPAIDTFTVTLARLN